MWQLAAIIIAGLFVVAAYPVFAVPAGDTLIETGKNFDRYSAGNGIYKWIPVPERVQDDSGNWKNYILKDNGNTIDIITAVASYRIDKNTCNFSTFNAGPITAAPNTVLKSYMKEALNGTNTWTVHPSSNASCQVVTSTTPDKIQITGTKSNFNSATSTGASFQTIFDIDYTKGYEWTYKTTNRDVTKTNQKFGFTTECAGAQCDNISLNGISIPDGTLSRSQIGNSTFNFANANLDLKDYTHFMTWAMKKNTDSLIIDFTNSKGPLNLGSELVIDPTNTYTSTTVTDFVVPSGTTSITVKAWGAGGGQGWKGANAQTPHGGGGGFAQATLSVTSGQTYKVVVGGGGGGAVYNVGGTAGANGGGAGGDGSTNSAGGGGGYSGVFHPSVTQANAKVIAGGGAGGGAGWTTTSGAAGGPGGGTSGVAGTAGSAGTATGGGGGTQSAGGTAGSANGSVGSALQGGKGGTGNGYDGGGGGGGYYGGGGGGHAASTSGAGGGGGSGYVTGTSTTLTAGSGASVANSADSDYASGKGNGGSGIATTGADSGQNGYVVISYTAVTTPDAPTAVSGSAASATSVSLSWTAPSSNGGASITDYTIQYSSNSGSTWSTWSHTASTSTSQTVTGLSQGTSYIFRVAAVNSVGTGSYSSNSSSVTTWGVPGAPTSVSGSSTVNNQVALSWTAPASNGGTSITDYVIQYSSNSGSTWTTFADGTSTSTSATVTGLTSNTSYIFKVAAVNSVGTGSYSSNSSSVLVRPTTPGAPTGLSATVVSTSQIDLTWSQPSDTGGSTITDYTIQYSTDNTTWTTFSDGTSASLSASVTGLSSNTLYYFKVAALNAQGTGSYSSSTSKATLPNAPTALSGTTVSNTSISLSWTAPSGTATSDYEIKYSSDNITFNTVTDGVSTSTSVTLTGLSANQMYYFKVAAINSAGTGAFSSVAQKQTAPSAPTGLSATVLTSSSVSLSWTAPTGGNQAITDYKIEYSSNSGSTWTTFSDGTSTSTSATVSGLTGTTSYLFRVSAYNAANVSGVTSSTASATTYTSGSVTVNLSKTTVGATTRLTWSSSYSGTPSPTFTYTIKDGSTIATQSGTTYYYAHSDKVAHTLQVIASDVNHWNNPSGSDSVSATATYEPNFGMDATSYNTTRTNAQIALLVNRDQQTTWNLQCNFKTGPQVLSNSPGTWLNQTAVWYYNQTYSVNNSTGVYIQCYDGSSLLLNLVGFNTNRIAGGITLLNDTFDSWLGVPVAMIFVLFVAGMFSGRTAPTGILLILAMIGVMGFIGLLTISNTIWAFVLLAGTLGIFIGKRFL